jgi:hypothetical protein
MIVGEQLNLTIDFTGVMGVGDVASAVFVDKTINGGFETVDPNNADLAQYWNPSNSQANSISRRDELCADGSFESGTIAAIQNAWNLGIVGEFSADASGGNQHGGLISLKCTTTRTATGWNAAATSAIPGSGGIPINPAQQYFVSLWVKQTAGTRQNHIKVLYLQDAGLTTYSAIRDNDFVTGGIDGVLPWTQFTATLTPPSDARYAVLLLMSGWWDGVTGSNAQMWFDDVRMRGQDSTPVYSGSHGMTIDFPIAGVNYGAIFSTQGFAINPLGGEKIKATMWIKSKPGSRLFGPYRITYANAGSVISSTGFATAQPSGQALIAIAQIDNIAVTTGWTQFSNVFTTPAGYNWAFIELYANDAVTFPATFYIDDMTIGLGPQVTVFNASTNETVPSAIIGVPTFSGNKMNVTLSSANLRPHSTYIATFTATATGTGLPSIVSVLLNIVVVY